jgi:FkbM family methyltransferase
MLQHKESVRFLWSHESVIHRGLVRAYNFVMRFVPFGFKYTLGKFMRRNSPPYNLIRPGSVLVQIGAPQDTLLAGRSRAMYFCLFTGPNGKVIVVEPDEISATAFQKIAAEQRVRNFVVAACAAWSIAKEIKIFINPDHPASNFVEGTKIYDDSRLSEYQQICIPADTMDNIIRSNQISKLDMISITTNGSEREILRGLIETISRGVELIALARTGDYTELMKSIGYELHTYDDRGFIFRQRELLSKKALSEIL